MLSLGCFLLTPVRLCLSLVLATLVHLSLAGGLPSGWIELKSIFTLEIVNVEGKNPQVASTPFPNSMPNNPTSKLRIPFHAFVKGLPSTRIPADVIIRACSMQRMAEHKQNQDCNGQRQQRPCTCTCAVFSRHSTRVGGAGVDNGVYSGNESLRCIARNHFSVTQNLLEGITCSVCVVHCVSSQGQHRPLRTCAVWGDCLHLYCTTSNV